MKLSLSKLNSKRPLVTSPKIIKVYSDKGKLGFIHIGKGFDYILLSEHEKLLKKEMSIWLDKDQEDLINECQAKLAKKDEKIDELLERCNYQTNIRDEDIENLKVHFANDEAKWIHAVAEQNKQLREKDKIIDELLKKQENPKTTKW